MSGQKNIDYACKIYIRHFKHLHGNFEHYQSLCVEKKLVFWLKWQNSSYFKLVAMVTVNKGPVLKFKNKWYTYIILQ